MYIIKVGDTSFLIWLRIDLDGLCFVVNRKSQNLVEK